MEKMVCLVLSLVDWLRLAPGWIKYMEVEQYLHPSR